MPARSLGRRAQLPTEPRAARARPWCEMERAALAMSEPDRDPVAGMPGHGTGTGPRELWDRYYGPLAGWCATKTGDPETARDIASEAFVRLLSRRRTVRDPRVFLYA